ncbi:MAG: hypothetical protein R3C17_04190 [Planctomycetaceae bacterium]
MANSTRQTRTKVTHTYQLFDARGNAVDDSNFVIKDNAIVVRDGASLDFETSASQTLHVQVSDKAGATHIEDITIRIEDANDAPTAIKLDGGIVSEAAEAGTVVGKMYTADADKGDSHTYQLVDAKGNVVDDANFVIADNVIVVRDGASLDFETSASQTLHVQVTDKAAHRTSKTSRSTSKMPMKHRPRSGWTAAVSAKQPTPELLSVNSTRRTLTKVTFIRTSWWTLKAI